MSLVNRSFCVALLILSSLSLQAQDDKKPAAQPARRARQPNPALAPITDDPKLPRVLVIGDSISIGYTLPLRKLLEGKANLHRIPANGGPTTNGLKNIDAWLGNGKWDVIHFNWGLHDLKFIDDKNALVDPDKGHVQVPAEEYEQNLRKLVERLKQTNAKLIWRSTTPVPEGSQGRIKGDEVKYNAIAKKIMDEHGIEIDDQYSFVLPKLAELQLPANVHFKPEGSEALAVQAAKAIEKSLAKSQ